MSNVYMKAGTYFNRNTGSEVMLVLKDQIIGDIIYIEDFRSPDGSVPVFVEMNLFLSLFQKGELIREKTFLGRDLKDLL